MDRLQEFELIMNENIEAAVLAFVKQTTRSNLVDFVDEVFRHCPDCDLRTVLEGLSEEVIKARLAKRNGGVGDANKAATASGTNVSEDEQNSSRDIEAGPMNNGQTIHGDSVVQVHGGDTANGGNVRPRETEVASRNVASQELLLSAEFTLKKAHGGDRTRVSPEHIMTDQTSTAILTKVLTKYPMVAKLLPGTTSKGMMLALTQSLRDMRATPNQTEDMLCLMVRVFSVQSACKLRRFLHNVNYSGSITRQYNKANSMRWEQIAKEVDIDEFQNFGAAHFADVAHGSKVAGHGIRLLQAAYKLGATYHALINHLASHPEDSIRLQAVAKEARKNLPRHSKENDATVLMIIASLPEGQMGEFDSLHSNLKHRLYIARNLNVLTDTLGLGCWAVLQFVPWRSLLSKVSGEIVSRCMQRVKSEAENIKDVFGDLLKVIVRPALDETIDHVPKHLQVYFESDHRIRSAKTSFDRLCWVMQSPLPDVDVTMLDSY